MAHIIFIVIIVIVVFEYVLDGVLDYLNSTYWTNKLPDELKGIYDEGAYRKSQDYLKTNQRFSFITSTFSLALLLSVLVFGGFAWLDALVRSWTDNPVLQALLFFGMMGLASNLISTPFSIYSTFVIEERFGFNKTTIKTFFLDKIKGWLLGGIIGGGMLALIVWIYTISGAWFWLIAWGVITLFTLFMTFFYSTLIVPLFNKQTPLQEGDLRDQIEALANKVGFQLKNIFVIDGSKRSTKANAYFTGFGPKKRIVLYDTLIQEHSVPELVAVLAHEIGHYKKKHVLLGMVLSFVQTGILLFILSLFLGNPVLSEALGASNPSFHMAVLAFGLLYSPLSMLTGIFMNLLSRRNEFAADRFAAENYEPTPLMEALKKLSVKNLSNLRPHPAYVFVHYSHPPLLQRLAALKKL